jgi:hypothetical protein
MSSSKGSGGPAGKPFATARTISMISRTISPRTLPVASLSSYSTAERISALASSLSTKFQSSSSGMASLERVTRLQISATHAGVEAATFGGLPVVSAPVMPAGFIV